MDKTVAGKVTRAGEEEPEEPTGVDLLPESKYRVVREISTGSISRILEVEHSELGRTCAAKVLRRPFSEDERLADALLEEGRLLASVRHPNIVEVIDVGRHPVGGTFLVLELLDGMTLEAFLAQQRELSIDEALFITEGLLAGLSALHEANVVHRSLHPTHVFLARQPGGGETVKLLGLGMARRLRSPESQVTDIGHFEGEIAFVAPEQREPEGGLVDPRTDLFTVGALLYAMIAGHPPAPVTSEQPARSLVSSREPVPMWLEDAVARALSYSRVSRFARCEDMRIALQPPSTEAKHEFEDTTTLERQPLARSRKILLSSMAMSTMPAPETDAELSDTESHPVVAATAAAVQPSRAPVPEAPDDAGTIVAGAPILPAPSRSPLRWWPLAIAVSLLVVVAWRPWRRGPAASSTPSTSVTTSTPAAEVVSPKPVVAAPEPIVEAPKPVIERPRRIIPASERIAAEPALRQPPPEQSQPKPVTRPILRGPVRAAPKPPVQRKQAEPKKPAPAPSSPRTNGFFGDF